eukprot:711566-Pyramimonas_sp.AAC.1
MPGERCEAGVSEHPLAAGGPPGVGLGSLGRPGVAPRRDPRAAGVRAPLALAQCVLSPRRAHGVEGEGSHQAHAR